MPDKRMLIVSAEVADKIDQNRGDLNRSDFINLLIDGFLIDNGFEASSVEEETSSPAYITKEEFIDHEQGIKELLRKFLEFFLSYGLELGTTKTEGKGNFDELKKQFEALKKK